MNTAEEDEGGLELAELPLRSNQHQRQQPGGEDDQEGEDYDDQEREETGGRQHRATDDQAPLLARDSRARAARRERRARKREGEASRLRRQLRLLWKTLCVLLLVGVLISAFATLLATVELRRHLGRMFFALPLMLHLLLDAIAALAPLLAAENDGQGEPPPPRPTSQLLNLGDSSLQLLDADEASPLPRLATVPSGRPPDLILCTCFLGACLLLLLLVFCSWSSALMGIFNVEFQRQLRTGQRTLSTHLSEGCCRCEDNNGGANEACHLGVSRGLMAAIVLGYVVLDAINCAFLGAGFVGGARGVGVEADGTVAPERRGVHAALTAVGVLLVAAMGVRVLLTVSIAAYLRTRSRLAHVLRGSEPPWHYTMSPRMQRLAVRQAAANVAGATFLLLVGAGSYVLHSAVNTGSDRHFDRCDPLDATLCALPFPSSYFLEEDVSSPTGYKVSFGPRSLPYTRGRKNVSPDALNAFDGFSTLAPILFYLEGMSASGFVGPGDIGASLFANSTTWLIEAETGRMVPHFVELDAMDSRAPLGILQPAAPLRHATRYIVAVCGALGDWGELLQPTPGFLELVEASEADRTTRVRPDLRQRAKRFSEQVFPALRKTGGFHIDNEADEMDLAGAGLGDVQIAWDFVTASEEAQLGDLRAMRDATMVWLDEALSQAGPGEDGNGDGPGHDKNTSSSSAAGGGGTGGVDGVDEGGEGDGGEGRQRRGTRATVIASELDLRDRHLRTGDSGRGVRRKQSYALPFSSSPWREHFSGVSYPSGGWDDRDGEEAEDKEYISLLHLSGRHPHGAAEIQPQPSPSERPSPAKASARRRVASLEKDTHEQQQQQQEQNEKVDARPPSVLYRVLRIEEDSSSSGDPIVRTVWARMRVPAFVSPASRGSGLAHGGEGDRVRDTDKGKTRLGAHQKTLEVGFVVRVPRCVASGERAPTRVLQYGHGLFGDRSEVLDGFLGELAERGAWVLVAADWRGLSRIDLVTVAGALVSRPELLFSGIPEDLMQGFVNQEAVLTLVSRRLGDFLGDKATASEAVPSAFYGISEGAILGAGYSEFSSIIERSVLGSGGTPFSLLMPRSVDFSLYRDLLELNLPRDRDIRLLLSMLQMSWDRLEASAWLAPSPESTSDTGDGVDEQGKEGPQGRQTAVLMQAGTGDAEVSLIGTDILARAYKAIAVPPVSVPAWGIPAPESGTSHCAENEGGQWSCCSGEGGGAFLAVYNYKREAAEVPEDDTPPPFGMVHFCVRHDPDAKQQVFKFLDTGCVVNFCNGACDRQYCRRPS